MGNLLSILLCISTTVLFYKCPPTQDYDFMNPDNFLYQEDPFVFLSTADANIITIEESSNQTHIPLKHGRPNFRFSLSGSGYAKPTTCWHHKYNPKMFSGRFRRVQKSCSIHKDTCTTKGKVA